MILKLKSHITPLTSAPLLSNRWSRIAIAIGYTTLLTVVLVQSSARPMIGPSAPKDFNLAWEILLTLGHLIGFSLLVLVNWSALAAITTTRRALIVALVFACLLGLITEFLQTLVPDRSGSLFDLACDWGVALATAFFIHRRSR